MKSKYAGQIFEGRWKVLGAKNSEYVLENIYNQNQIVIHNETMRKLVKGETTISNIISYRLYKSGGNPYSPYPNKPKSANRVDWAIKKEKEKK